jgi:hypothetical protein
MVEQEAKRAGVSKAVWIESVLRPFLTRDEIRLANGVVPKYQYSSPDGSISEYRISFGSIMDRDLYTLLVDVSEKTGIPRTKLIESAIRLYIEKH